MGEANRRTYLSPTGKVWTEPKEGQMAAVAEQWQDESVVEPVPTRRSRPATRAVRSRRSEGRAQRRPADSWNVLAEEIVSFPTRSQQVWWDAEPAREQTTGSSRDYADAWLERELERLHDRRVAALSPARSRGDGNVRQLEVALPAPLGGRVAAARPDSGTTARPVHRTSPARSRQAVAPSAPSRAATGLQGLRRLLPGAATLAVLAGLWFGVGTLASAAHPVRIVTISGEVPAGSSMAYVARPGDTLWSIAERVEPGSDPRALVDELQSQLRGQLLQPGDRLLLPR